MRQTRRETIKAGVGALALTSIAGCFGEKYSSGNKVQELPQPTLGSDSADVTLRIFEDFQCPHCKSFNENRLPEIQSQYVETGDVQIEFWDFPLPVNNYSKPIANAARAVQDNAGNDGFWTFAHRAFANQQSIDANKILAIGSELMDQETLSNAQDTAKYYPVIEANRSKGEEEGIVGTPGLFVGWEYVQPDENVFNKLEDAVN